MSTKLALPLLVVLPDKPSDSVTRITADYTTYTCECGESYVDNLVEALGHNYVQSGNVYTCTRCGDSYTGHEHNYTEETTEPSCTQAGYTIYTCSCGDSYQVNLPALGHDYVMISQDFSGKRTYRCTRCGATYTDSGVGINPPIDPDPPVEYSLRNSNVTVTTEHHEYIYASGKLLREVITTTDAEGNVTTQTLDFTYDTSGNPYSLTYNGTTYYYVVNLQGDVIRLVSGTGATVAEYEYDPYGRVISGTGTMAEVNPLRYRGYYYDAESEFYYLQSRYYDPATCRFVNADTYTSTGQSFLGYNMFAYCGNNPKNRSDYSGHAWWGNNTVAINDVARDYYSVNPSPHTIALKDSVEELLSQDQYSESRWNNEPQNRLEIMGDFLNDCEAIMGLESISLHIGITPGNDAGGWNVKDGSITLYKPYCDDHDILRTIAHEVYHAYQDAAIANPGASNEPASTIIVWSAASAVYEQEKHNPTTYSNNALEVWAFWFAGQERPEEFDPERWSAFS